MDVDETLTDGKIYMGSGGEMYKTFDIKDGCGIKETLSRTRISPFIITAGKSRMLEYKCKKLILLNCIRKNVRNRSACRAFQQNG